MCTSHITFISEPTRRPQLDSVEIYMLLWQQDWYFFTGRPMMSNDIRTRNKLLQLRFFLQLTLSQHLVCCLGWILSSGVYEWTCVSEEDGMVARRISRQNFNIFKYENHRTTFLQDAGTFFSRVCGNTSRYFNKLWRHIPTEFLATQVFDSFSMRHWDV